MSNLSNFLGGGSSGGGIHLGYIETADGTFEKIANGAGVAYLDYSSGDVLLSDDGTTSSVANTDAPYFPYTDGLWIQRAALYGDEVKTSFSTASAGSLAVAYDHASGDVITSDSGADVINVLSGYSSTVVTSFPSPGGSPHGLCVNPFTNELISCDSTDSLISRHDGISQTVLEQFASPVLNPRGVEIDPFTGDLIFCAGNNVYVQDGFSAITTETIDLGVGAFGVAVDNITGNMVVATFDGFRLYEGISNNLLKIFPTPFGQVLGVTFNTNDNELIICSNTTDLVYVYKNLRKFALALTEATA